MTDNLELGRIGQNLAIAAVNAVDTALSRLDGRFSAPLTIDVGADNEHTISQNDLRFVSRIVLTEGSPGTSGAITITINPSDTDQSPAVAKDMGGYFVLNQTANDATFQIGGQPNAGPVIPANSGSVIHVTSTAIWGLTISAASITFDDTDGSSPNFQNLQDLGTYLLANIGGGGGGGGSLTIEDEGSSLGAFTTVNFVGAAVVATDAGAGEATVTVAPVAADIPYTDPIAGSPSLDNVQEALDYALNNLGGGGGGGSAEWTTLLDEDHATDGAKSVWSVDVSSYDDVAIDVTTYDPTNNASYLVFEYSVNNGSSWLDGGDGYAEYPTGSATVTRNGQQIQLSDGDQNAAINGSVEVTNLQGRYARIRAKFNQPSHGITGKRKKHNRLWAETPGPVTNIRLRAADDVNATDYDIVIRGR